MSPAATDSVSLGGTGSIPAMPIEKVLRLFTGPNSDKLYDRHISAVERLCKAHAAGFPIKDLPQTRQLLELTLALIDTGMTDFVDTAVALLKTLTKPFVKTHSTDEFRLVGNITDILRCVAKTLATPRPQAVQLAASEMLLVYASGYGTRPSALVSLPSLEELSTGSPLRQYLYNNRQLLDSGALQHLVAAMALAELANDEVLTMSLALALAQVSHHPDNVHILLGAGILQCLPTLLSNEHSHPAVPVAVELLWNLLERAPGATRAALLAPQPTLAQITSGVSCADVVANIAQPQAQGSPTALQGEETAAAAEMDPGQHENAQRSDNAEQVCEAPSTSPDAPTAATLDSGGHGDTTLDPLQDTAASANAAQEAKSEGLVLPAIAEGLTALFKAVLLQGYRAVDKELRNDMLVVINLVMGTEHNDLPPAGHHPRSTCGALFCTVAARAGLFQPLLAVSTSPELGASEHPDHAKAWALTTEEADLELKQLAWRACAAACVHTGPRGPVLPLIKYWGFMRCLLAFVEPSPEAAAPAMAAAAITAHQRWAGDPFTQLRLSALSCLHSLAPLCPETYLAESGSSTTLRLLTHSTQSTCLEGCLRHLHSLVEAAPEMAEVLGAEGGLRVLLELLQDDSRSQAARHYCLLVLASVCRVNTENLRRLRHDNGVLVLLGQLAKCRDADPTLPSAYTVAALDAVWACVVADRKNSAKFLVEDGMDALLDLLEGSNKGHRAVILAVLCDLLENTRSHPFFLNWKSPRDGKSSAQLLLSVWRDEEAARGMTAGGLLANTAQPLAGTGKRTHWVPEEAAVYPGLAETRPPGFLETGHKPTRTLGRAETVALLLQSASGERCLAKVYGCFRQLGFSNFPDLSPPDAATLALIEMYVKFKQGELWAQIQDEFAAEGLRPTAPDRERIESGIELCQHLGKIVRDTQGTLLAKELQRQADQEKQFYENMRAQRKLEQEARFYKKDKSQLTLAELREAKQKKEMMLRASIRDVAATMGGMND